MKIVVIGDIHGKLNLTDAVKDALKDADLLFLNGDLTDFGGADALHTVLDGIKSATGVPINAVPGNCDNPDLLLELERAGMNMHRRGMVLLDGTGMMSVGGSNKTPFGTPTEFEEEDIAQFLEDAYRPVSECESIILFSHFPPRDTDADKIKSGAHVGSATLREFIMEHPSIRLVVCGHIHEAMGIGDIRGIPVVNHGMGAEGHYVEINTNPGDTGGCEITFELY